MAEEFIKTIYHVVKVNSDNSFIPTTKNIIYTGEKLDTQEIFLKRIAESQNSELYALVCEKKNYESFSRATQRYYRLKI